MFAHSVRRVSLALAIVVPAIASYPAYAVDGWASVGSGCTGGIAGSTVTVNSEAALKAYAGSASPYVIRVSGTITLTAILNVNSNKTIVGVDTDSKIEGQINVKNHSNVIIRYLTVTNPTSIGNGDGIHLEGSGTHHVWIDHCTIFDTRDGALDNTWTTDYITISWCKFYYTQDWGHNLVCLISSSDTDVGSYRITWHHNWWSTLCKQRQPNVKHGYSHVYNCYWDCTGNNYCTDVRLDSQLLSENNYYNAVNNPLEKADTTARLKTVGNVFSNCAGYMHTGSDAIDPILYSYTLDPTARVPVIVRAAAGNVVPGDSTPPMPDPMTWATEPYAVSGSSITMAATMATDISGVAYYFDCKTAGGHDSGWQTSTSYTDTGLNPNASYTYTVKARDASVFLNETVESVSAWATTGSDTTAPLPNPMTWSVLPYGTGFHSIAMVAETAIDVSGIQYYFACTAGSGHDSGWQDSRIYIDSDLIEGDTCTYTVKARDKSFNHNETAPSLPAEATTLLDTIAPTPSPMTFAVAPAATGPYTVAMTASTAADPSGVEYFFACTSGGGHDSGWQDGTEWTDTSLVNSTTYAYHVMARDKSFSRNQTGWSDSNSVTTPRYLCTSTIASDLSRDCQVDFLDYALMANQWTESLPLTADALTNGAFETDILSWQTIALPGATGFFVAYFDETTGNPPGSAVVGSDTNPDGTTGQWFFQMIPVIAGKQYKLSGEWMGDLAGYVAADPCNRSNWAEVKMAFESNADPNKWTLWLDPNAVMYSKAFGATTQNIGPSGVWDWEQITASPTNGPADGVFVATDSYMVIALGEGGLPASGVGYYYLDNLQMLTSPCPSADFSGDCFLDMKDVAAFAQQWLACNRNPAGECWQ